MTEGDLFDRLRALRGRLKGAPDSVEPVPREAVRRTVMLVDDDEDNLDVMVRHLSRQYELISCRSGEEAVREFVGSAMAASAVVMDIRMPGMSGLRAARLIRDNDPYVPIVFQTGFSDQYPEDEILSMYDGTVDYVTKGQRGHDFYLDKAVSRGIKSYDVLRRLHHSNQRLKEYDVRLQAVVEQLITHEKNLQTAVEFQESLLGHVEDQPGYRLAALHRFCEEMGGDFYDVLKVGGSKTGVLVADVSGHGIPAALMTGMLKAQIEATDKAGAPAEFLKQINLSLFPTLEPKEKFLTAVYVVADGDTGEVEYASAGHNPIALVRADGSLEEHGSTGFPVGTIDDLQIEQKGFKLNRGDSIWLYTDGLFESPNVHGESLGRQRLVTLIRELRGPDLESWAHAFFLECERFVGSRPIADDMTVLSLMAVSASDGRP